MSLSPELAERAALDLRSDETKYNDDRVHRARAEERERCLKLASAWLSAGHVRLHAGEMTKQEMRSVMAVVQAIVSELK